MRSIRGSIFLMLCLFSLSGVAAAQWPLGRDITTTLKAEPTGVHVTATGRFQIFVSPNIKEQTFMLDTDTGRVWILRKDHASGDFFLRRVPVDEVDGARGDKPDATKEKDQRK
ncbi:MAG: hypothetical protein FJ118_18160 [Deltaproteobacteria bacterium]|nr:hypothetical protein [Deltaproteobacteria bacterium]